MPEANKQQEAVRAQVSKQTRKKIFKYCIIFSGKSLTEIDAVTNKFARFYFEPEER
jgi:hypothetical protein